MLDLSPDKLLMLAVVALVVLGPNRLPGAARTLGRFIGQIRAMSSSLQDEVRDALHDPHDAFSSALTEFHPAQVRRSVRRAVAETLAPVDPSSSPGATAAPVATNLPPGPSSAAVPVADAEVSGREMAGPPIGWGGHAVPDDPGFN